METDNLFNDAQKGGSDQSSELATIGDPQYHMQNFYSYGFQTCELILEAKQSKDQIRFRSLVGVDDAFAVVFKVNGMVSPDMVCKSGFAENF